jgi:hypothetical protein
MTCEVIAAIGCFVHSPGSILLTTHHPDKRWRVRQPRDHP